MTTIVLGVHAHLQTLTALTTATTTGVTTTTGSTLVAIALWSSAEVFSAFADSKTNTWTLLQPEFTTSFGSKCRAYGVSNATGGAGHTISLTTTTSTPSDIFLVEIQNAATVSSIDQVSAWGEDTGTPFLTPTTGTTVQNNEMVLGVYTTNTPSGTETLNWAANGFTQIDSDGNSAGVTGAIGYKIVSATGAYAASVTSNVATGTAGLTITIKDAVSGGGGGGGSPIISRNAGSGGMNEMGGGMRCAPRSKRSRFVSVPSSYFGSRAPGASHMGA